MEPIRSAHARAGAGRPGAAPFVERVEVLDNGTFVLFRPVRSTDAALLARGFDRLSPQSRYRRFFSHKLALTPDEIAHLVGCDGRDHIGIAAVCDAGYGEEEGLGVARLLRLRSDAARAEASVTVIDDWQGLGLGTRLLQHLRGAAATQDIREVHFVVLAENAPMLAILRKIAPDAAPRRDPGVGAGVVRVVVPIR